MSQAAGTNIADLPSVNPARRIAISFQETIRALARNKAGFVAFIVLLVIVAVSVFGPFFLPRTLPADVNAIYVQPGLQHPLGTDSEGRDVLLQIVAGGRTIILVGFVAAAISTLISITFGALAAYAGGAVDSVILMLTDIVLTIPQLVLLLVLAASIRLSSPFLVAGIIAALSWPTLLRAVRAQVLSLKEREYVEAARILDLGTPRILFQEILPNMASFILLNFTLGMTGAIYAEVALYLLGLAPASGSNWGVMLNTAYVRGAIFYKNSLFYILAPVLAICLVQFTLLTMTRSLEDVFNPRLRRS